MEKRISGHTGLLALIGSPVGHSGSPAMYNYSFEKLGLDYAYVAFDIKEDKVKEVDILEDKINGLLSERETLISTSKLPITGLSFTDEGLELNGVPFIAGKVSDSQIMEVATKLIIASNPTVKVFRIARGESLGEKRLKTIIEIAKKNGFQGFIEEVKRGQEDLIIEEYSEKQ